MTLTPKARFPRVQARGRMLAYALLAAAVVTCDSPTAAGRPGVVALVPRLAPVFSQLQFSGLVVDQARITITRPPSEMVAQQTFAFPANSPQLNASVNVLVQGSGETFDALIELLAAGSVVFSGTQQVRVTPGPPSPSTPPVQVTVAYTGPGTNVAALGIAPAVVGIGFGQTQQFTVTAVDSQQQPVASFYAGWQSSDAAHVIDAQGLLRTANQRGSFWVVAQTPTGIRDSARVTVSPTASAVAALSGGGQTGSVGTRLAQPIVARVTAADGGPVAGVTVAFDVVSGGGSVDSASVVTDSLGLAGTTVVLGPNPGSNLYRATVGNLPRVTFTATGTSPIQPRIILFPVDTMVGVGFTQPLRVWIVPSAPAGGVVVNLVSDSTQYLTVAAPGSVTIPQGDSIRTINLTGVAAGLSKVRAAATGYPADSILVAVIPPILQVSPPTASVGVGSSTTLTVSPRPRVSGSPLAVTMGTSAATVATVTPGTLNIPAGQFSGTVSVQGVGAGVAGITADAAGYTTGGAAVTVSTGGVPTTLQVAAGSGQTAFVNDTVAVRPAVTVLDAGGAPVAGVQVLFAVTGGGGSVSVPTATTNASGVATLGGTSWRMGGTPGANALSASLPAFPAVTAVTFTATAVPPPPVIALSIFGSTVVGQARQGQLQVRLLQAAPAGGLTVNLATTRTGLLRIGTYTSENGSVAFAQGDTLKTVTVFGDSLVTGTDTVIGTGTGYTPDTLAVPISLNLISLPPTLNVQFSQNVSLPINLSVAAPAGGLKVAIASSAPGVVAVVTDTVTVPQGSQVVNATVTGVSLGTATLTATNPNYAPDVTTANVTASLNIIQTSIAPNASFGTPITIQLESSGSPVAAPAGGIAVTVTPRNTACAAAPNTTIPAGLVSASVTVTYGGSATLPCSTYVVATGPAGFIADSVLVNMAVQPVMGVSATYLGSGLQRAVSASLGAGNHGGTTVRLTSANPAVLLVAPNDTTAGANFVDVPVGVGGTSVTYYLQAQDGVTNDSSFVIATAPGFVPDTAKISVYQAVFDVIFLNGSGNTRSVNDPFQARVGSASLPAGPMGTEDEIRFGGATRTFSLVNDSVAVGDLVTQSLTGDSVTVQIAARQSRSPGTVATGGVEFDYTAGGVTNVRASSAGGFFRPVGAALGQAVTVTAPTVTVSATFIGARLQRAVSGSLSAAAVAGDTVTLHVTQPGILRISPNDSTGFADTVRIGLAAGATSFTYYIQGVDSIVADTVDVVATLPAYRPDTAAFRVYQPVFDLIFLNGSGNTRTANDPFQARTGTPSSPTGGISVEDELRFGHPALTFSVVNDSAAVGDLVTTALTGDSVTVQIVARQSRSPSTVATGGVEFDYLAGGVTNVRASSFGGLLRPVGAALGQTVTVTAPTILLSGAVIGARLQRATSGSISAAAVAGDTITLKVAQPGILRISPNDSTGFADSIRIGLAAGATSFAYYIQGVDTITADTVDVLASMPAYTSDTASYRVYTPVYDIIFLNGTANTLAANDPFQVRTGTPGSPTGGISVEDALRFGHPGITATLTSVQPTVAQLVTQTQTGSPVTVGVAPRQSRSPATVATGGVELDYLTTGSTVVIADIPLFRALATDTQTVTVTAPFATVSAVTVGAGLQTGTSGSLSSGNHGGISVVVKSSNPAVALVSPNVSTPGTDSIIIAVGAGSASFSYVVQGLEGTTGAVTIRATAPGFTDGTGTATIVQPAVDIIFLSGTGSAASTADDAFQARTGYSNLPTNSSMSVEQEVRAGAPGPLTVTITTTNPAAGLLNTSAQTGQSQVTLTIPAGQSRTPTNLALGGVSFDFVAPGTTRVVPVITGFVTVQQTSPFTQPGFQVTVGP